MESDAQFKTAVRELQLKVANTEADKAELKMLLNYYLRYPSMDKAYVHHRACNLGTNDLISNQKKMQKQIENKVFAANTCQCCGLLVNSEELPYNTHLNTLNIGLAVHLFFKNYKFHVIIFTLMFLIYSLFAFITNIRVYNDTNSTQVMCILTASSNGGCGLSPIGAGSKVLNQNSNSNTLSVIESWIGVGFVALWGFLYIIKTHTEQKFIYQMEQKRVSASDFTLMLTHVPKQYLVDKAKQQQVKPSNKPKNETVSNKYAENRSTNDVMLSQEDLRNRFNKIFIDYERKIQSKFSYEVIKVNVAKPLFDKNEHQHAEQEKIKQGLEARLNVFRKWIEQRRKSSKFLVPAQAREQCYDEFIQFYINSSEHDKQKVGLAEENVIFVTLRSSQAMREIQRRNKPPALSNFWNIFRKTDFPIQGVKVRKAPYPEEIKWNCVGFPLTRKRTRRFFMWLLTLILIGISLGISIGIAFINKDQINIGVSIGISIVVTFINIGIQLVIVHASYYENQYISSRQQSMIALKIGLGQIANSIGVPIIVTLISQSNTSMKEKSWLKSGGLVDDVFFIAIINILVPIVNFIDPWEQYLRVRRWWNEKPMDRLKIYGQKQYNKLYGNYTFDIGYEYAYLIKTSIFTSFFVCMQPIIALFAPLGLILYYLSTKRNLYYHFQKPNFHFSTINHSVDFILLISLPAFGLGCLLVNNFIQAQNLGLSNGTLLSNWIIFIIGIAFLIIVPLRIFYCCIKKPNPPQFDYIQKRMLLNTDYDRLNPETKQIAVQQFKNYLDELQKKQQLPDEAKLMKATIAQQVDHDEEIRKSQNNIMKTMVSRIRVSQQNIEPEYNNNLTDYKNIAQSFKEGVAQNNSDVMIKRQAPNMLDQRNNSHDNL